VKKEGLLLSELLKLLEERNIFLTGGAGVGKSYLTKEVIAHYKGAFRNIVVLGSTGISAVHVGGQTIHSFFVFGIADSLEALTQQDRYAKSRLKELSKILRETELIIIDEISMVSAQLMEMILYRLRSAEFGGRLMVVGDFYQLPPVRKAQQRRSIFDEALYAFESSAWEVFDFVSVELTKIKRTRNSTFMQILEKIRRGETDHEVLSYLKHLRETTQVDPKNATILFGRNFEADRVNRERIAKLPGQPFLLPAKIETKDPHLSVKRVESWKKMLPVLETLELKEGAQVIFTANKWGFYHNGERGRIEHIDDESIVVEIGRRLVKVERSDFTLTRSVVAEEGFVDSEILCTFSQFPLRPAYAITIHKSQGMSIDDLICNVDHIFAESQFYVALSRAVDPKRLRIDYTGGDFEGYLKRVIRVSERVGDFYRSISPIVLD